MSVVVFVFVSSIGSGYWGCNCALQYIKLKACNRSKRENCQFMKWRCPCQWVIQGDLFPPRDS